MLLHCYVIEKLQEVFPFTFTAPALLEEGGVWVDMTLENRESGKLNLNKTVNSSVKQALKMMSQKHKINVSQRYNKSNI